MSRSKRNAAAEDYLKRAPNYSAEAIADLLADAVAGEACGCHTRSSVHRSVAAMLDEAHKFVLPDGGRLFSETKPYMAESFRLPFKTCVFEFSNVADGYMVESDDDGWVSGQPFRWVVLATEREDRAVVFTSVFAAVLKGVGRWTLSAGYGIFPADRAVSTHAGREGMTMQFGLWADLREYRKGWAPIARWLTQHGGARPPHEVVGATMMREAKAIVQACAALACTNVTTEILRPNREARAARPASTLFDYHVLMIDPSKERHPSEDRGGTHASPRTHLRRGHIRRLAWGARIWVNQCVVNPSAIGTVNKDYAVKGGKK